jgi:hypothetical protein
MNSDLKGKSWQLSPPIKSLLINAFNKYKNNHKLRGYNIVKNLIKSNNISYENAKRIKNLLENVNQNSYELLGGEKMLTYLNGLLNDRRKAIKNVKKGKKEAGIENAYLNPHEKDFDNTNQTKTPSIREEKLKTTLIINETQYNKIKKLWQVAID